MFAVPDSHGNPGSENSIARKQIVLNDGWLVRQMDEGQPDVRALEQESSIPDGRWLSARMPAQVHDILQAHHLIPDPHIGTNSAASAWIGAKDWAYACRFPTPKQMGAQARLRFEGLDTLADAYLNGSLLGQFENMFREYAVDVKDCLVPVGQTNVLLIIFHSPLRFMEASRLPSGDPKAAPHKSLRKCHSDFSSYLGARPHAVKVGIYRDVVLDLTEQAWIEDVWIQPKLSFDLRSAQVFVVIETRGSKAALQWILSSPEGVEMSRGDLPLFESSSEFRIDIKDPQLWWPRSHGKSPLYHLEVNLTEKDKCLDRRSSRFGIREVKPVLKDPLTGENRFRFDINQRPVFMLGANWVPLEGSTHVWNTDRANQLLDLAEQCNMNMLRIWGEGIQPPSSFYEECDRRGICLWQDFMFGYYDHSAADNEFLDNCRAEIGGMIRRLRGHPSIILWCGGNEQYLWASSKNVPEAKRTIFERMMPELCRQLDPGRLFHTSSPYGGPTGNWPLEGDWHDYTTINFAPESAVPLFASEVLRASVPPLKSMKRFLSAEEIWPKGFNPTIRTPGQAAWPPAWAYHSTGIATWDRVGPLHNYCDPSSAEELIRIIGTAHGDYLRERVERERRGVLDGGRDGSRRCWGNLVWRLNDTWPMIYGSVVDYYLEPKIAYYFLKRAYEPLLLSFETTANSANVWIINDSSQSAFGTLSVERLGFDGKSLGKLKMDVSINPGQAKKCLSVAELGEVSLRTQFLRATFGDCEANCLLIGERYLHLPQARLTVQKVKDHLEISTDVFARQVTVECEELSDSILSDNYFDLAPGQKRAISMSRPPSEVRLTISAVNAKPILHLWKN